MPTLSDRMLEVSHQRAWVQQSLEPGRPFILVNRPFKITHINNQTFGTSKKEAFLSASVQTKKLD